MKIRICTHNKGSERNFEQLKIRFPERDIKLKKCVKQCKICKEQQFICIDKRPYSYASFEELAELIEGING